MKSYIGILRLPIATTCDGKCETYPYEFWLDDGTVITNLKNCQNIPLEVRIEILLDLETRDIKNWTYVDKIAASRHVMRKDIALMYIVDEESSINDALVSRVEETAKMVEHEYKKWAAGIWEEVTCTPYVFASTCTKLISGNCWIPMRNHANKVNPGNRHNYWHIWGGTNWGFCGHGYINGTQSITYANCGFSTIIHEIGHNFGLHHSGANRGGEYGEPTWMGSSGSRHGFNAAHLRHIGLVQNEEVEHVRQGDSKRVFLTNPIVDRSDMRDGEYKLVQVTKNDLTRGIGYFNNRMRGTAIQIYRPDPDTRFHQNSWSKTWLIEEIFPGEHLVLDNGVYVRNDGIVNQTANVVVKWDDSLADPADFVPEQVLPTDTHPITEDITALWDQVGSEFQGFDIRYNKQRNTVLAYWYTYDSRNTAHRRNDRRWYMLQGEVKNNIAHLKVYTTSRTNVGASRNIEEIGEATLYFPNGNTGMIRMQTSEHGRIHRVLNRISKNNSHPLYGVWDIEENEKEGFSISVHESNDPNDPRPNVVAYWYTYTFPRIIVSGLYHQEWFMATGKLGDDLTLYNILDASYGGDTGNLNDNGKIEIRLDEKDNNKAVFEYFNTQFNRQMAHNLKKLF